MLLDKVTAILSGALPELQREFPIRSLALFGSIARGEDHPGSDIDVLVAFTPGATVTLMTMSRLVRRLTALLGRPVDVVEDHPHLRPSFRAAIERDLRRVA